MSGGGCRGRLWNRHRRRRQRRAVVMIEFAITLPFMLFFLAFLIDMGRLVMAANAMQEVTYRAARAAAVYGAAGGDGSMGSSIPSSLEGSYISGAPSESNSGLVALWSFADGVGDVPGSAMVTDWRLRVNTTSDAGRLCTPDRPTVSLTAWYEMSWITPGMGGLLGAVGNQPPADIPRAALSVSATARCEVEVEP